MAFRVANSLLSLVAEINAIFPNRSKATDGSISGYTYGPGQVIVNYNNASSHNINSEGVVCAYDITTAYQQFDISDHDGQLIAEVIRRRLRDQPRGTTAYEIHHMAPPFVPYAGPWICHGNWDWSWAEYTGIDGHTSHSHVSADYDCYPNGAPSGLAAYDTTLPWDLAAGLAELEKEYGVTLDSKDAPEIEEELDMAAVDTLLARMAEIVSFFNDRHNEVVKQANENRDALAGFVRELVTAEEKLTREQVDAKLAELTAVAPIPERSQVKLVKGDGADEVYAWDGSTGYRHIGQDEFIALSLQGATLDILPQAELSNAIQGAAK